MADIKYTDFEPSEEERKYASTALAELIETAPSDATIAAEIKRRGSEVVTELGLKSSQFRCKSETTARTIYASVDKAIGVIEEQIFDWKASVQESVQQVTK